jgi:anaerobic selenocysteine-containing dehydrogenase
MRRQDIREGSVVKVYNDRGAILAGVHLSEQILPGWYRCPPAPGMTRWIRMKKERSISTVIPTC